MEELKVGQQYSFSDLENGFNSVTVEVSEVGDYQVECNILERNGSRFPDPPEFPDIPQYAWVKDKFVGLVNQSS